ncbi:hypothetical protein F1188_20180 [Roseospira marina]|uniref:Uncharacterized protein n=1 Tax=Roseospira marina TaxID=140057 RepID=A0A5M6I5C1_9PROT|nr:hypothetical protein [Roseospira marina]KAA5603005.1 hypothetical protein F1188_20180 [Roseospira marina]MBB4313032.1 hypothetical protein [Roseospira marina]MBB5089295.1 hypothetical protein [Roseospira marina]
MTDLFSAAKPRPHTDAAGRLITLCAVPGCRRPAVRGEGVSLLRYLRTGDARALGTWWCGDHWRERTTRRETAA